MAKRVTKQDLKIQGMLHDIVLKVLDFCQKQKKLVLLSIGFLVCAIVLLKILDNKKQDKLAQGFNALYKPMKLQKKLSLDNSSKEQSTIISEYEGLLNQDHPNQVLVLAAVKLAAIHKENGNVQDAIQVLSKVNLDGDGLFNNLGAMMLANLHEETDNCSEAIMLWSTVAKNSIFFRNSALLKKALCLEDTDKAQALDIYAQLSTNSPETNEGKFAKKLLLIQRGKHE